MADITVRVAAKSFIKSTGTTGVTSQVKGNPLITQGSGHTIEWKVTLPTAGKWKLHALLSSHIPNPCQLIVNGAVQDSNVLGEATNGASSDTQHWFSYGPFDFKAGENVFAIKCLKAQPSLWEFGFSLEQPAAASAPAPTAPAPAPTAPAPAPTNTNDSTFLRLPSKDFTSATPGTAGDDPAYGGTVCSASTTPFLEYKVNLPKAGKWHFHVSLAAQDSRPAALTINGVRQQQAVCGNVTGTWNADSRKWFVYGPFDFKQGENVFRLDFSNCMPHLKEFGFSESMLGVANVTEWPTDLVTARESSTVSDGSYSNLLATAKTPASLEWKLNVAEAGHYTLHALMTSDENRPGTLSINGVKQSGEVLGQKTGGWYSDKLTWVAHGPYEFEQGENVLRMDFNSHHPHLRELGLTRAKAADKPVQTGPTKLGPVGSLENATEWEVVPKAGGALPRITAVTTGHCWSLASVAAQWDYAGEAPAALVKPQINTMTGFFEIPAGDHLVAIHVGHGAQAGGYPTNEVITLQYETLKGLKSPVYGGQSGQSVVKNHVLRAPDGQQIVGFFGANGGPQNVPLRIGVYVGALPAARVAPSNEEWQKLREALDNRIGALEARIAALEAELAKCQGCCAKVDALTAELASAHAKLATLTDELAALRAKLEERDAKCGAYEQKIVALEKQFLDHERVHAVLEKALAAQERSNVDQERKLLEQDKKLAEQERSNVEQERKLLEQDKKLAEQERSNVEQERKLLDQDRKFLAQDRKLADYEAIVAALEAKLAKCGDCAAKIQELEGKLAKCGDCEAKVQAQEKTIADLTERLAKLEASRVAPGSTPTKENPVVPPVWPPPSTPARMGISYIHFVGLEKNTQGDEYIEIKNTGGTAQDVSGWRVRAGSASQEFVFPVGSVVAPGAACRIYTNRAGECSFNAKRAVWNDAGDVGMLYDAAGKLVCEHGYGTKETRSLDNIKATYGVEQMKVAFDDAQIAKQKRKNDKIDFLTAVERAIRSLLEDSADEGRPNAANQVRDNVEGVPRNASASVLQSYIRDTMNKGELQLVSSDATDPMSTKDQWIFRLRPGMGDQHWVIIDRMGAKAAYQEIT